MKGIKKKIRDNRYLNWLLILSNWCFQGIPNADKTEKYYKILFTIIFGFISTLFLFYFSYFNVLKVLVLSFFIGHTINWIINGNFYGLLIHRLLFVKVNKESLFNYLKNIEGRLQKQTWVLYAASFGSICRGELKDSSDIDISIVRKHGLKNALKSMWFALKEKKIADFYGIPLEVYISDTPQNSIKRFAAEQNPVIIFDPYNTISNYYTEKLTLEEAFALNNFRC